MSLLTKTRFSGLGFAGVVLVNWYWPTNVISQEAPPSPPPITRSNRNFELPPSLLVPSGPGKSPVDLFRELLAMNPTDRGQLLTNRSPDSRRLILAKVREYESLKANQRELRLKATELRWYLLPMMRMDPTNRTARLAMIPEANRKLVEDRLQDWDKLPAEAQKKLLDNEATLQHLTEVEHATLEERRRIEASISPARRQKLEEGIAEWRATPEDQRQKTLSRFTQFFELTETEKDKALKTISGPEQRQMEKTLRSYSALTSAQRAQCIRSFQKFAELSLPDRQLFLKNAERWKRMSPDERQEWRDLVSQLPLMPVDPVPPMPTRIPPSIKRPPLLTNTN